MHLDLRALRRGPAAGPTAKGISLAPPSDPQNCKLAFMSR